jgi:DinB superfamily
MASAGTQPPREPDELEKLRRDRGEGWEWHRIQADPCPQCGYHPAALPRPSLAEAILEEAAAWRAFLSQTDEEFLRTTTEFGIFTPIQYGAHVRDMLQVAGDRILLGIEQDNPVVPIHNPPQEEWDRYSRLTREELAADLTSEADRLAGILAGIDPSAWNRIVINDRGVYGVYSFTLAGLACNAAHEAHHHLLDAKGTLASSAPS